ncbi:MAG: hypothetical protein Q8901_01895 [Candidatus Phytoplasma stylosanthis]|nr:hypothetical protein [Candidatus Phytoplasma stylosanthis]
MKYNFQKYLKKVNEINELFFIYLNDNRNNHKVREEIFILFYVNIIGFIVNKIKYFPKCLEKKDLINEGTLSIEQSLLDYCPKKHKCDFFTFTRAKIRQQIDKLIRISHIPSIPTRIYNKDKKYKKFHKNSEFLFINSEKDEEYEYNPYFPKNLNPHELYMKKVCYEIFFQQIKINLSQIEYQVFLYSYGILENNISTYNFVFSLNQISSKLNITKKQVYKYRENGILKLKKKFYKKYFFLKLL